MITKSHVRSLLDCHGCTTQIPYAVCRLKRFFDQWDASYDALVRLSSTVCTSTVVVNLYAI